MSSTYFLPRPAVLGHVVAHSEERNGQVVTMHGPTWLSPTPGRGVSHCTCISQCDDDTRMLINQYILHEVQDSMTLAMDCMTLVMVFMTFTTDYMTFMMVCMTFTMVCITFTMTFTMDCMTFTMVCMTFRWSV